MASFVSCCSKIRVSLYTRPVFAFSVITVLPVSPERRLNECDDRHAYGNEQPWPSIFDQFPIGFLGVVAVENFASSHGVIKDSISYPYDAVENQVTPWGPSIVLAGEKHHAGGGLPSFTATSTSCESGRSRAVAWRFKRRSIKSSLQTRSAW